MVRLDPWSFSRIKESEEETLAAVNLPNADVTFDNAIKNASNNDKGSCNASRHYVKLCQAEDRMRKHEYRPLLNRKIVDLASAWAILNPAQCRPCGQHLLTRESRNKY